MPESAPDPKALDSYLHSRAGAWVGRGLDPEGNGFHAWLSLEAAAGDRAFSLRARLVDNDTGSLLHEGEGIIGTGLDQRPILYFSSNNTRATLPRPLVRTEASASGGPRFVFGYGDPAVTTGFRDEIALTFYDHGRVGFSWAWAIDESADLRRTSVILESVTSFEDQRPVLIRHWTRFVEDDNAHYPGSDELLSIGAPLGRLLGLKRIGVHLEQLPPGRRTSFPHAESTEEEFVFVLAGFPHVWLDGDLHALTPGDVVSFPSGTGIAHTFINNGDDTARLLVIGETRRPDNQVNYPLNPERRSQVAEAWWDIPEHALGPHDGLPDALRDKLRKK